MHDIIGAIIIIIPLLILSTIIKNIFNNKNNQKTSTYSYEKKTYFFTKNELFFYRDLITIAHELDLTIFAKPRLADIIEPPKNISNWNILFNKIRSKHVDFLLCSTPQIKPILVIELDDNSHNTVKRQERDNFIDSALQTAGIPILHVRGSGNLQDKIKEILQWQQEIL